MTSEIDVLKTNEILRRRKLRILQVREQSKDIAKKIRQRANVEKLRHIVDLDAKKEKAYLEKQEKLVEELEKQYAHSLKKIGSGHRKATSFKEQGSDTEKRDLSKERGKVAAAQIREQKQKYLDEKKKILDRKLHAREIANELSRDKGVAVANKIKTLQKGEPSNNEEAITVDINIDDKLSDMATQCDIMPKDQVECNTIPSVENEKAVRELTNNECLNKATKRHDLFAISDEMPTSLRGSNINYMVHTDDTFKPSNVISDYIQNRDMRLRQPEPTLNKSSSDDLQKIRHTIVQTRAAMKTQPGNICHVLDNNMIPVPSWHAEHTNQYHLSTNHITDDLYINIMEKKTTNQIKNTSYSRRTSPIPRNRIAQSQSGKSSEHNKSLIQTSKGSFSKRNTLTTYNHSSRDERNVIKDNDDVVVRDLQVEEDAYSQAIKENSLQTTGFIDNHQKKLQDMRHKVAVTKQKVEKEYEDTMNFLKTLPKETVTKSIRKAYMSDHRQHQHKEKQQKILQQEFKNIAKDCRKHVTVSSCPNKLHSNVLRSCIDIDEENVNVDNTAEHSKPTLYSWVPVPESDNSLIVHKIPNAKRNTSNVKFDDENSYHEYRSRHKHTPPTKDKSNNEINKSSIDDQSKDGTVDNQSMSSNETNEKLQEKSSNTRFRETINAISDQDKIIIYKILDNDKALDEEDIKESKFTKDVFTSLTSIDKKIREALNNKKPCHKKSKCHGNKQNQLNEHSEHSIEQLTEGVYKTIKEKGSNITSLYYSDSDDNKQSKGEEPDKICKCTHPKKLEKKKHSEESTDWKMQGDSEAQNRCNDKNMEKCSTCGLKEPASSESTSSFKSAQTAKDHHEQKLNEHVKLADSTWKDAGNFYIGASGYLKDAYEVIIQLRKKENNENIEKTDTDNVSNKKIQKSTLHNVNSTEAVNEILISDDVPTTNILDTEMADNIHMGKLQCPDEENKKHQAKDNTTNSLYKHTTTAYTQTSMYHSPKQNPIYYHMSSSTSTTYMSPPDNILPSFLKHRQVVQHTSDEPQLEEKKKFYGKHTVVESDSSAEHVMSLEDLNKKPKFKKNKHKSHKCKKKSQTVVSRKVPSRCGISNRNTTITAEVINNLLRKASNQKNRQPNLNPIIKNYVDKVLQLSKDGIKAVEVAAQNCSSATTPGSSIVNIPSNIEKDNCRNQTTTISIEQIVKILENKFIHTVNSGQRFTTRGYTPNDKENYQKVNIKKKTRHPKIKHRIKSLNISKHLMNNSNCIKIPLSRPSTSSPQIHTKSNKKIKRANSNQLKFPKAASELCSSGETKSSRKNTVNTHQVSNKKRCTTSKHFNSPSSDMLNAIYSAQNVDTDNQIATDTSTQTNDVLNYENKIIEIEENKIQNMEKIANLTEKCTKRLSDLAKVLEEVRKNKSTTYGHISNADSSSSDREHRNDVKPFHQCVKTEDSREFKINGDSKMFSPEFETNSSSVQLVGNIETKEEVTFVPVLGDLPKPQPSTQLNTNTPEQHSLANSARNRCKPPPALSRVSLKCVQEGLVPHELSTVPEIESPLSLKLSSKLSPNSQNHTKIDSVSENYTSTERSKQQGNPDILLNNLSKSCNKLSNTASDMNRPKVQMMDLNKFNEMMLKPFVSIEEYAQQCKIGALDEGSNLEDLPKDGTLNDEISSLHSDGSLPDVVSELLKLKIINEPFRYDSISNANSTSLSSESSASMLVLSKKKKHHDETRCKKNEKIAVDTSDSLSVSSNHDLETVFKNMGISWFSSTLKKTKERLALSSSTSTSTSSASHRYTVKRQDKHLQNMPVLVNDTLSKDLSGLKSSCEKKYDNSKSSKNVKQQTSLMKSSVVKDLLTNELADKITFTHDSHTDNSDLHFTSLYSTKFPLESENVVENLEDVARPVSRQRTSTPVQLYKSMHYDTNSSSNNYSNGLFSNVDDLSSVKVTSSSLKNNSNTDKDELSIPNCSLKVKKDCK